MVTEHPSKAPPKSRLGLALIEMMVSLGILTAVVIPLGFTLANEQRLCRAYYYRSVAMEIVDGEMEILAAGEWRSFKAGAQEYPVRAEAAKNLPPGKFMLTLNDRRARLEWSPNKAGQGGEVCREAVLR